MELVMGEGEGRCGPGPRGSRQAAARSSLAPACSESSCSVSGRLCQAAEGRGTQCLARPPGSSGSSAAQGLRRWTQPNHICSRRKGDGPGGPPGPWACPPAGGCLYVCLAQATRIWAERSELSFCKCKKQQTEENLRLLRAPQRREAPLHELRATRDAPRLRESNKTQRHRLQATPPVALAHHQPNFFPPNPPC